LVPIAIVTLFVADVSRFPAASSTATVSAGVSAPLPDAGGCVVNTSFDAAPAATVSETLTVWGLFVTPVALEETGTDALYDPAASEPVAGVSVNEVGAVDALTPAVSHPPVWPAPYVTVPVESPVSVPVPPFVIVMDCAAGLAAPDVAEKVAELLGESRMAGADPDGWVLPLPFPLEELPSEPPLVPQEINAKDASARTIRRIRAPALLRWVRNGSG
jgi:hypothetical protein